MLYGTFIIKNGREKVIFTIKKMVAKQHLNRIFLVEINDFC